MTTQPRLSPEEEFRRLILALRNPSAEIRAAACFRLEVKRDPRAIDPLVEVLRNPREDAAVRSAALSALEAIGGPLVVQRLVELMGEAKANDWLTVFSLAGLGEEAFDSLLAVLNNPKAKGRAHAAAALGLIGDQRAVPVLLKALRDNDPVLRSRAAVALGRVGDPNAFDSLVEALRDSKPHVHRDALWALSELGDQRTLGLLMRALRDPSRYMRKLAADCLGELGAPQAVPELERLEMLDKNPRVVQAARQAITRIEQEL
jgi:HEAT repeat protein